MKSSSSLVGLGIFAGQVLALIIYACGFFEFRSGKRSASEPQTSSAAAPEPIYDRLVFVLIDALRADFVYGEHSKFAFLRQMINEQPEHTKSFVAKARPPTVTMPRLKALTAGSPPIFLDLILNFDETGIANAGDSTSGTSVCGAAGFTQDTWVQGIRKKGGKIVFYGDDTWTRLFPHCFDESHGVSSFFVQDYTHVDNQVTERLMPRLQGPSDWTALILHYLGVDHIGHIDGAKSKLMGPKQEEMDGILRHVYKAMAEKDLEENRRTLILVLGDHGMADNGNHGGSSEPEVNTAAIVLSPSLAFDSTAQREVVDQVDLVPTISQLMGLPIPSENTGVFIQSLLPNGNKTAVVEILRNNIRQLQQHLGVSSARICSTTEECQRDLKRLSEAVNKSSGSYNLGYMITGIVLTALCLVASIRRTFKLNHRFRFEFSIILVYTLFQASSSFIEEEHEFWYFALASLIVHRHVFHVHAAANRIAALPLLLLARLPRYWNAIGYQRAQDVDARSWLPPSSFAAMLIFLGATLIIASRFRGSRLWPALSVVIVNIFKAVQSGFYSSESVSKSLEVTLARLAYLSVTVLIVIALRSQRPVHNLRMALCLFFLFLLKIHNALIVLSLGLLGELLSSAMQDGPFDYLIALAFVHYSYFALGPSNLLVSLDFSNAYVGLTEFNMLLISSITFLMTWSGPIIAALLFFEAPQSLTRCIISDLSLWRSCVALGLLGTLLANRDHLFIWTVFAPRLLFEFGWTIFYAGLLAIFCLI